MILQKLSVNVLSPLVQLTWFTSELIAAGIKFVSCCYGLIQVMFLVGLTLSALTVSTSDASFAGYVAKSVKLSHAILMLKLLHLAFGFTHELIILAMSSSSFVLLSLLMKIFIGRTNCMVYCF
jgi:hypothetical protein